MDTNKALGVNGAGQIVHARLAADLEEREWTILPPARRCLAAFQAYLESEARRNLVKAREDVDQDTYEIMADKVMRRIDGGEYEWGRPEAMKAVKSRKGGIRLIAILMRQHPPQANLTDEQVTALIENNPEEFKLAFQTIMKATPSPKEPAAAEGSP